MLRRSSEGRRWRSSAGLWRQRVARCTNKQLNVAEQHVKQIKYMFYMGYGLDGAQAGGPAVNAEALPPDGRERDQRTSS